MPLPSPARARRCDPTRGATLVRPRPLDEAATLVRALPAVGALDDEDVTAMFSHPAAALQITRPELPLGTTTAIAPALARPQVTAVARWAPWPPPALIDTPRDLRRHAGTPPSRIAAIVLVVLASLSCVGGGALLAHASLRPVAGAR